MEPSSTCCVVGMPTPLSPRPVRSALAVGDCDAPESPIASAIANRRRRSGSLLGSPSPSPNRRPQAMSKFDTSASHNRLLFSQDKTEGDLPSTIAAVGRPNLLVDYLTHSLEEAKATEDRVQALEAWASELQYLAGKLRVEVIELRNKVSDAALLFCASFLLSFGVETDLRLHHNYTLPAGNTLQGRSHPPEATTNCDRQPSATEASDGIV
jgi:hypothetical protein